MDYESDSEEEIYWDSLSKIVEENVTNKGMNVDETPMEGENVSLMMNKL